MKNLILAGVLSTVIAYNYNLLYADEEHAKHSTGVQTLIGEVTDIVCYISHGEEGLGPKHADCARKCIESGLPVAIKVGNNLYIAVNKDHSPANNILAKYAGKIVTVSGEVVERDGEKLIEIETIK